MITSTGLRRTFGALALAFSAGMAAQPAHAADEADPRFKALAEHMAKQTTERCNAAYDGDAGKGQVTNKDVATLMSSNLGKTIVTDLPDERVGQNLGGLARGGFAVCVDNRLIGKTNKDGQPITAAIYLAEGTPESANNVSLIAISPVAPDPAKALASSQLAVVDAAEHLQGTINRLQQAQMFAQLGHEGAQGFITRVVFHPISVSMVNGDLENSVSVPADPALAGLAPPGTGPLAQQAAPADSAPSKSGMAPTRSRQPDLSI